jgi:hypothetical protein
MKLLAVLVSSNRASVDPQMTIMPMIMVSELQTTSALLILF